VHCTIISPEFKCQGQSSKSPGTKNVLSAADTPVCVRIVCARTLKTACSSQGVQCGSVVRQFYAGGKISACCLVVLLYRRLKTGKGFPYSIPSVGPGADPGVQAVSLQVTVSHPPGGRLPLLSASPAVTSPAAEHHRPLAGTKLYCLLTEAHRCKQLA